MEIVKGFKDFAQNIYDHKSVGGGAHKVIFTFKQCGILGAQPVHFLLLTSN